MSIFQWAWAWLSRDPVAQLERAIEKLRQLQRTLNRHAARLETEAARAATDADNAMLNGRSDAAVRGFLRQAVQHERGAQALRYESSRAASMTRRARHDMATLQLRDVQATLHRAFRVAQLRLSSVDMARDFAVYQQDTDKLNLEQEGFADERDDDVEEEQEEETVGTAVDKRYEKLAQLHALSAMEELPGTNPRRRVEKKHEEDIYD
jgi:hypothetical protein